MLNRNPLERLGANGGREVKAHPFFSAIDFDLLYARKIPPPFDPCKSQDESTSSNFEKEFTSMPLHSVDEGAGGGDRSKAVAAALDSGAGPNFLNFTYEEESVMESMRDSYAAGRRK